MDEVFFFLVFNQNPFSWAYFSPLNCIHNLLLFKRRINTVCVTSQWLIHGLAPLSSPSLTPCFLSKGRNKQEKLIKEKVNVCVAFNERNPLWQVRVKLLLEVLLRYCQSHLILLWGLHFPQKQHVWQCWGGEQRQQAEQPDEASGPRGTETSLTATRTITVRLVGGLLKFGTFLHIGIRMHSPVKTGFTGSPSFLQQQWCDVKWH